LAYISFRGNEFEIRRLDLEDGSDVPLLSWHGDAPQYVWSANGERLYVALGVGWDWQIWGARVDRSTGVEPLVTGAVTIAAIALSPDGSQLAFTAAPELEYPLNRHRLYVQPLDGGVVQTFDLDGDAGAVAWTGGDTLLVVTRLLGSEDPWVLPARRVLRRVHLSSGAVEDVS
jgi:Tol biopolymer transport system component